METRNELHAAAMRKCRPRGIPMVLSLSTDKQARLIAAAKQADSTVQAFVSDIVEWWLEEHRKGL